VALLMVRQVRGGHWGHVDATDRRERPVLYAVGGGGVLVLLGYLAVSRPGSDLMRGAVGTLGMLVVCAVLTRWIKLSLHMAAAALAATTLLRLASPAGWVLAAVLPVLAWSRVSLGRHSWAEVALGLAVGAATALAIQAVA
jgi:membrane-associated phospholipid phosphatase